MFHSVEQANKFRSSLKKGLWVKVKDRNGVAKILSTTTPFPFAQQAFTKIGWVRIGEYYFDFMVILEVERKKRISCAGSKLELIEA